MSTARATKRRRLLDAGGPIENDATARQKMKRAAVSRTAWGEKTGFDPDNVRDAKKQCMMPITPMVYFTQFGDLKMMRWLYANGASAAGNDEQGHYSAMNEALFCGREEEVKWLFLHGAAGDLRRDHLRDLFTREKYRSLFVWLTLNGLFCRDDWLVLNGAGLLDVDKVTAILGRLSREDSKRVTYANARRHLLEWAVERHETRTSFLTLLNGTLSQREGKISSSLVSLDGTSGILELVADYSGILRGREARIVRHLVELLPGIYRKLEDVENRWANLY